MSCEVRVALASDAPRIAQIYNHYIEHSAATFEEAMVASSDMQQRMSEHHPLWLVAEVDSTVVGYAYAGLFNSRSAYRFSQEVTVYLAPENTAARIGTALYEYLFDALRLMRCHSVIAGITLPNVASVALHEKFGMQQVAHLREVGFKFDRWLDVGYWQVKL